MSLVRRGPVVAAEAGTACAGMTLRTGVAWLHDLPQSPLSRPYPAIALILAIISSTALSTGTFSLTIRFMALAQTFSLFTIVNL
jgi:hypothetical protein